MWVFTPCIPQHGHLLFICNVCISPTIFSFFFSHHGVGGGGEAFLASIGI